MIGYIVMGLIILPLAVLGIASVFEEPRTIKIAAQFTGAFFALMAAMLLGFLLIGIVMSFIVP
jgi:hypothetical protein